MPSQAPTAQDYEARRRARWHNCAEIVDILHDRRLVNRAYVYAQQTDSVGTFLAYVLLEGEIGAANLQEIMHLAGLNGWRVSVQDQTGFSLRIWPNQENDHA